MFYGSQYYVNIHFLSLLLNAISIAIAIATPSLHCTVDLQYSLYRPLVPPASLCTFLDARDLLNILSPFFSFSSILLFFLFPILFVLFQSLFVVPVCRSRLRSICTIHFFSSAPPLHEVVLYSLFNSTSFSLSFPDVLEQSSGIRPRVSSKTWRWQPTCIIPSFRDSTLFLPKDSASATYTD